MTTISEVAPMILSLGDPAGVGPEVAVKACVETVLEDMKFVLAGPKSLIVEARDLYAPNWSIKAWAGCFDEAETLYYDDFSLTMPSEWQKAKASAECGQLAYDIIVNSTKAVIAGKYSAIVTAPASKESVNLAGIEFTGHTELIADLCGCKNFNMMQSADAMRFVFVTNHIALNRVSTELTKDKLRRTITLLHEACLAEGIEKPKLAAAGLNPHAGEMGYMGREEIDTIIPVLEEFRAQGVDIEGPFPPDTLFIPGIRDPFNGFVCMYHDQGHIPFKMLAFDRGVNSTLGLPIIRTSVDHGTAFNIAWQGKADTGSLKEALRLGWRRALNK